MLAMTIAGQIHQAYQTLFKAPSQVALELTQTHAIKLYEDIVTEVSVWAGIICSVAVLIPREFAVHMTQPL